jgi:branched-chain amino acid transport system substrate-binding protein
MKRISKKILGLWFLALWGCLSFAFLMPAYAEEPIKIGVLAPQTGPWAFIGRESLKGIEIALDVQNAKGGIKGRKIEYIVADTPDTTSGIAECERIINIRGVNIIVPAMISALSYTISPICERNKKISWHANAASDNITQQGFKYLFRTSGCAMEEGGLQADFARDCAKGLGMKVKEARVAIVYEDGVYGTTIGKGAEKRAQEIGLNVVHIESYSAQTQDLSSLVMRLKSKNPDILLYSGYPPDTKIFLRQMQTLGLKLKALAGTGASIGTDWFRETYGDKVNTYFSTNWPVERTSEKYAPGMPQFVKLYKKKYNKDHLFSCHSATGFTGMLILWDVLQRAKSMDDPDSVREAALATDIPVNKIGCGWGAKFAPPGHAMMGTNLRAPSVVTQWLDNELWTMWPIPYGGKKLVLPMTPW